MLHWTVYRVQPCSVPAWLRGVGLGNRCVSYRGGGELFGALQPHVCELEPRPQLCDLQQVTTPEGSGLLMCEMNLGKSTSCGMARAHVRS